VPRFARIHYPGGIYHVISRCLNGEFLLKEPSERQRYLRLLEHASKRTDSLVLAWCLMSNHTHLVVRAGSDDLSRLLKPVNTGYAVWLNRRQKRHGPVFSNRYKSILIDEEEYLFQLIRYVHNNPVRAGLVKSAKDSDRSSHRAYIGLETPPEWLNIGYVLGMFSKQPKRGIRLFHEFVESGAEENRRPDLCGERLKSAARRAQKGLGDGRRISGPILGSKAFAAKVLCDIAETDAQVKPEDALKAARADAARADALPELSDVISLTCSEIGLEPWEFEQRPRIRRSMLARRVLTWLWVRRYHGRQIDIARSLKVSSSVVSRWYGEAVERIVELEEICGRVESSIKSRARPVENKSKKSKSRIHYYDLTMDDEI
jgi:putative transposase